MEKTIDLLESYEWLGEFWFAGSEAERFPGILRYSAMEGLVLTTMRRGWSFDDEDSPPTAIHGLAVDSGPITLFSLVPKDSMIVSNGEQSTSQQHFMCGAAILGGHFSTQSAFSSCTIEFNNLAELFHPQGFKSTAPFTLEPLLAGTYPQANDSDSCHSIFNVRVQLLAIGRPISRVSRLLLVDEASEGQLARDLDSAVESVLNRHQKSSIASRSKLDYLVCIQAQDSAGYDFSQYRKIVKDIQGLFSLLFLKTVRPLRVSISPSWDRADEPAPTHPVLFSLWLTPEQVSGIRNDKRQYISLPITSRALNGSFPEILIRWSQFIKFPLNIIYPTLLAHIAGPRDPLPHFILQIASVEQCAVLECGSHTQHNVRRFFETFAPPALLRQFLDYLPSGISPDSIWKCLCDIRNCIVHPAKVDSGDSARWLEIIKSAALSNLSELIHLLLISYVYERVGLSLESIRDFRSSIERHVSVYEDVL